MSIFASLLIPCGVPAVDESPVGEHLQQIQKLLQQGSWETARKQLADALSRFPREPSLHNFMGVVEAQAGNYAAAESSFVKALELSPRFTAAGVNLGRLYQENSARDAKAPSKALQVYQRILAYDPDNPEALFQTAVVSLQQGQYQGALSALARLPAGVKERPQALAVRCASLAAAGRETEADKVAGDLLSHPGLNVADILSILPALKKSQATELEGRLLEGLTKRSLQSPESLRALGLFYEQKGRLALARQTLEAAVTSPVQVSLLLDLARIAYKDKDLKGTLGYLAHARELEPKNFGVHFFFGMVCVEMDLLIDAVTSLKEAVVLSPENPYANYALGSILLQGSEPRDGLPYLQKYCRLKPEDPRGQLALGAAYFQLGEYDESRNELEKVVSFPEASSGAYYFLGRMAKLQGSRQEAYRLIQLSLKADPDNSNALVELGQLELRKRDYAAAEKALQHAVELDPGFTRAYDNLGLCYQAMSDDGSAMTYFEHAVALNRSRRPSSPWPPLNYGMLLLKQGLTDKAEPFLGEAVRLGPGMALAHHQLGVALEKQEKYSDAIDELKKAVELDPTYPEVHFTLAHVYKKLGDKGRADLEFNTFQKLKQEQSDKENPAASGQVSDNPHR